MVVLDDEQLGILELHEQVVQHHNDSIEVHQIQVDVVLVVVDDQVQYDKMVLLVVLLVMVVQVHQILYLEVL